MKIWPTHMLVTFWESVDANNKGGDVCWDTVMWDMFFTYPEMETDKQFVRQLYKLIDSVETQMAS